MKVLLFAKLRERAGEGSHQLVVDETISLATLRSHLQKAYPDIAEEFAPGNALFAVNQTLCNDDSRRVSNDDEVACFPPVTGG